MRLPRDAAPPQVVGLGGRIRLGCRIAYGVGLTAGGGPCHCRLVARAGFVHIDVLHTTRHFATNNEATMTMEHDVVGNNHVPTGFTTTTTVSIFTRLDANGIIASIEYTFGNQSVAARFQVECIAIL